tara:strand:+ start:61 stop:276 length:216 start_codon:yes stop_codon:yes gene_type:complete
MKKYRINKNQKAKLKVTKSDIQRHKSFNSLMLQYDEVTKRSKIPLYKNKKLFMLLIIFALIAYLIFNFESI